MRAGIYYRVSSEEQVEGYSLDAQRRALLEFCRAKGWVVAREYADEGKSARGDRIEKRPAFRRLLEDAEAGALDVVVVHKLDRFSRNIRVTFDSLARLDAAGVVFTSVVEHQFDFTTPMGKVMLALLAAFAQYFADNLAQETKKGKGERKAQGLYNGWLPFGVKKNSQGIPVPDPATYPGLLLASQAAAEGKSDREIATVLNERGYRTTGNREQSLQQGHGPAAAPEPLLPGRAARWRGRLGRGRARGGAGRRPVRRGAAGPAAPGQQPPARARRGADLFPIGAVALPAPRRHAPHPPG